MSEDRTEQLERKIAALEAQINPAPLGPRPAPRDYSAGLSMPVEAIRDMTKADVALGAIVRDLRRGPAAPASLTQKPSDPPREIAPSRNGWIPETPLPSAPPGDRYVTALMDAADARDRRGR